MANFSRFLAMTSNNTFLLQPSTHVWNHNSSFTYYIYYSSEFWYFLIHVIRFYFIKVNTALDFYINTLINTALMIHQKITAHSLKITSLHQCPPKWEIHHWWIFGEAGNYFRWYQDMEINSSESSGKKINFGSHSIPLINPKKV